MSAAIELIFEARVFERVEADLAVAGFYLDERPLRGAAGRADWRLCGAISRLLGEGSVRGRLGEAVLMPSFGRLAADRILLLGLGRRSALRAARAEAVVADALRRAVDLRARCVALEPPGVGSSDFGRFARAVLRGAVQAVRDTDAGIALRMVVSPGDEERRAHRALEKAVEAEAAPEIRVARERTQRRLLGSPQGAPAPSAART